MNQTSKAPICLLIFILALSTARMVNKDDSDESISGRENLIADANNLAKPFLKWAGGKTGLIPGLRKLYPQMLAAGRIKKYAEPFLGAGSVFFDVAQNYRVDNFQLSDINEDLIVVYLVVQQKIDGLLDNISVLRDKYLGLGAEKREEMFYEIRDSYNKERSAINFKKHTATWAKRAAQFIFLNKTCFNGLYRVNSKGEFNVPFGKYSNPSFYNENNLRAVSQLLSKAEIFVSTFDNAIIRADHDFFIYCDPPYRPISKTSSFNSYSKQAFNDESQTQLANAVKAAALRGAKVMVSNSDPKNSNTSDDFFERIYHPLKVNRIPAKRMINSEGTKRGEINEIVVTSY